jgi:hypothetical protein
VFIIEELITIGLALYASHYRINTSSRSNPHAALRFGFKNASIQFYLPCKINKAAERIQTTILIPDKRNAYHDRVCTQA